METWEFPQSNAKQQYATHGFLRYFGKLPPVVTRRILEESRPYLLGKAPVLDIACGSGTTLVEASLLGVPSVGVDVNHISVLVSRVKTRVLPPQSLDATWERFRNAVDELLVSSGESASLEIRGNIPDFFHRDLWFTREIQQELGAIISQLRKVPTGPTRDFLTVAFAGTIRRASNASERAGRVFREVGKRPPSPWKLMHQRVEKMRTGMGDFTVRLNGGPMAVDVHRADARATGLPPGRFGLVFFHPPYFALYKYSSDVLRFELEWLGFDRKEIARAEIRDGFKTTRVEDLHGYLEDLGNTFKEARRLVRDRGALVVISNNSTLRKKELPVISGIRERAGLAGFREVRHAVRTVRYAQASYHRSADEEIRTPRDHILFFEPA